MRGMAGQGFVNRVVDHFIDHMMQARAIIRVTNIHAGALAHGIKAFENFNRVSPIIGNRFGALFIGLFIVGHLRLHFQNRAVFNIIKR